MTPQFEPSVSEFEPSVSEPETSVQEAAGVVPSRLRSLWNRFFRFGGCWLGVSGFYSMTSGAGGACPYCGQASCPCGFVGAGLVGLIVTGVIQFFHRLRSL